MMRKQMKELFSVEEHLVSSMQDFIQAPNSAWLLRKFLRKTKGLSAVADAHIDTSLSVVDIKQCKHTCVYVKDATGIEWFY